jgi:hypothetical protein
MRPASLLVGIAIGLAIVALAFSIACNRPGNPSFAA